jgi:hypothetical protein
VANGYASDRDGLNRTREVTGALQLNPEQGRSRQAKAQAVSSDRRPTDEGGHIIARRFNGPKEAYNHFAQDRTFNRSGYRKLENRLARAREQGREITINVQLSYKGNSQHPYELRFGYTIDGQYLQVRFPNSSGGQR